jgi:hypothetical protein
MNENGFFTYMKEKKNTENKINSYIKRVKRFEQYLIDNTDGKSIDELTIKDLQDYAKWSKENNINAYQDFFGIREYYLFLKINSLTYACSQVMQLIQLEKFKLKDFLTANQEHAKSLAKMGIKTASQILEVGKTKKDRKILADKSNVPNDEILKFVKLANLARCPGHMRIRACLYYESGLDTFDKIASQEPEKMIAFLEDFIKKTGFNGSTPFLADAKSSIENSKRIPRIIIF